LGEKGNVMWVGVVTLFPEMFRALTDYGISRRAIEKELLTIETWNPRDFANDKHKTVDDKPYGGGPGMLMKVQPLKDAISAAKRKAGVECPVIYLSPQGKSLEQADLEKLVKLPQLILVAGRYEGIDERLIGSVIDAEVSIGDFVVSGGELPAMILIDGVTRLLPGAVGDKESVDNDSFSDGLLDYPQYTRPEVDDGLIVPRVLLSGDHREIARWRKMHSLGRTYEKRPDLIKERMLTDEERRLLDEYRET
jgi:tRNA (guanine37-N1)-methyltransferase